MLYFSDICILRFEVTYYFLDLVKQITHWLEPNDDKQYYHHPGGRAEIPGIVKLIHWKITACVL